MFLTNFRSSSLFFHSAGGKGFMKLVLGGTFSHFNELWNVLTVFIAEWHVHVYVSSTFPHSEQLDFSLKKCLQFHLLCQSLDFFFPWKAVQFWAHLDKTLVFRFLTKYLWGLSPARASGLVLVQEQDRAAANVWPYFVFQCRLCYTPVLEEYLLSFSFAAHSSGMEPHFHCPKLMLADNRLWAFEFFFKWQK